MNRELFNKYVNNTCTPEEKEVVVKWLESSANKDAILKEFDQYWNADVENKPDLNSEQLFSSILNTLKSRSLIDNPEEGSVERDSGNQRRLYSTFLKYAAVIAMILVAGIAILHYSNNSIEVVSELSEEPLNQRKEPKIREILLPDGTKVWLNAESKLKYPKEFAAKSREVYLDGEAYSEVVKNPVKPFIVRTSALDVKVLGTTFNVKSYKEDDNIETTLATGKILIDLREIDSEQKDLVLVPAEGIVFSKKNLNVKKLGNMDVKSIISWKEGVLSFRNETFDQVVKKLERWYGVEITSENISASDFRFTAKFEGETFEEVMKFINLTIPIQYTIDGNKVLVTYKP